MTASPDDIAPTEYASYICICVIGTSLIEWSDP